MAMGKSSDKFENYDETRSSVLRGRLTRSKKSNHTVRPVRSLKSTADYLRFLDFSWRLKGLSSRLEAFALHFFWTSNKMWSSHARSMAKDEKGNASFGGQARPPSSPPHGGYHGGEVFAARGWASPDRGIHGEHVVSQNRSNKKYCTFHKDLVPEPSFVVYDAIFSDIEKPQRKLQLMWGVSVHWRPQPPEVESVVVNCEWVSYFVVTEPHAGSLCFARISLVDLEVQESLYQWLRSNWLRALENLGSEISLAAPCCHIGFKNTH
ncbi:hypothetical protein V8G54_000876 [Vigna mungo]|uniref:Uncharacterized protein n=1 Tax=Vigna mungo TaxID=3915 RepID=A0AAQ3P7P1_VIGMU